MKAVTEQKLSQIEVKFENKHACCVVMASKGYPLAYEKGFEITLEEDVKQNVFVAGAVKKDNKLLTNGGRVLGVTEKGDSLKEAVEKAYRSVEKVHFDNAFYRRDIGKRALTAGEEK